MIDNFFEPQYILEKNQKQISDLNNRYEELGLRLEKKK